MTGNDIDPGFQIRDWLELARLSFDLRLPWAALRRVEQGLRIDEEVPSLQALRAEIAAATPVVVRGRLGGELQQLAEMVSGSGRTTDVKIGEIANQILSCGVLEVQTEWTFALLRKLFDGLQPGRDADVDSEELASRVMLAGRCELPPEALAALDRVLLWVAEQLAAEPARRLPEIEVYEDNLWPRSFEGEACGLITITGSGRETSEISVRDPHKGELVWHGRLEPGEQAYQRWVVEREDEFIPDDELDLLLSVQVDSVPPTEVPISVTIAPKEVSWPNYPPGSLQPSEVPGGELYGRGEFIRQIVSSFGPTRSRANYLIESVRQMGKTSLLFFIKDCAPTHVFPVYINLEAIEYEPEKNVWNYIIEQVLREAGERVSDVLTGRRHADLVHVVKEVCKKLNKSYVLLLMDELHVLLREARYAKSVLTELRADLNQPGNKISVLFADRYTLRESEAKVEAEIWLQLSEIKLGPLDRASTAAAVTVPCEGTDARFLAGTIDRIFYWTSGYPFHVQRLVQRAIERNFHGPWVTALPADIDEVIPGMIEQDSLFTEGLCRPERINEELQAAIAAFLEYKDLSEMLPSLGQDEEWRKALRSFAPQAADLLVTFGDPVSLITRLENVGMMKRVTTEDVESHDVFSPLLERWLRKMRMEGRALSRDRVGVPWGLSVKENVSGMTKDAWLLLDGELTQVCAATGVPAPLRPVGYRDSWDTLVREVKGGDGFKSFSQATFECFIEGRGEAESLVRLPWLFMAFHRARLVRNYFHHSGKVSKAAAEAWKQVCGRAVGRGDSMGEPRTPEEWRAAQMVVLRTLDIGLRNAIALVGRSGGVRG